MITLNVIKISILVTFINVRIQRFTPFELQISMLDDTALFLPRSPTCVTMGTWIAAQWRYPVEVVFCQAKSLTCTSWPNLQVYPSLPMHHHSFSFNPIIKMPLSAKVFVGTLLRINVTHQLEIDNFNKKIWIQKKWTIFVKSEAPFDIMVKKWQLYLVPKFCTCILTQRPAESLPKKENRLMSAYQFKNNLFWAICHKKIRNVLYMKFSSRGNRCELKGLIFIHFYHECPTMCY